MGTKDKSLSLYHKQRGMYLGELRLLLQIRNAYEHRGAGYYFELADISYCQGRYADAVREMATAVRLLRRGLRVALATQLERRRYTLRRALEKSSRRKLVYQFDVAVEEYAKLVESNYVPFKSAVAKHEEVLALENEIGWSCVLGLD